MIRRILPIILVIVGGLSWAPAGAHEGPGTIEVVSADEAGPDARTYRVRVVFIADGHSAPEATVTATLVNQPGAVPVSFAPTDEEGVYEGTVRFPAPGDWTIRLTSLRPIASAERIESIAAPAEQGTTTTSEGASTPAAETGPASADEESPSGAPVAAVIVAGAVVLAAAAAFAVARRRGAPSGGA